MASFGSHVHRCKNRCENITVYRSIEYFEVKFGMP